MSYLAIRDTLRTWPDKRVILTAILVFVAHCAFAGDAYPLTEADKKFLAEIVGALQRNDSAWIAGHMVYPLSVGAGNRKQIVRSKEEFAAILSSKLTDGVRARIADAAQEPPFKNWQGVMLGDGILWFSAYKKKGDKFWSYGILAIGGFAFQPKDISAAGEGPP